MKNIRGFWSKKNCKEKALTCNSRNEFRLNFPSAYTACLRNNWLYDVCEHLNGYKSKGYWNKENCQEIALKYKTRLDFHKNDSWVYRIAVKNDWLDDICSHMKVIGNLIKRCIYVYEFADNSAYIGLTFNIDDRNEKHIKKGTVYNHIQITPTYILKQLTDYIDVDEAKRLEDKYVKEYKKNGWTILNIIKTGGIGGNKFWTKEKCKKIASKYKTRSEFNKTPASIAARRYGWLEEINNSLEQTQKSIGYWTKEKCQEEALKYKTRIDFFNGSSGVFNKCVKKKWLNDICSHMENKTGKKPIGFYTKEKCQEEALKYTNRREFKQKSSNYYSAAVRFNWLNDITYHL